MLDDARAMSATTRYACNGEVNLAYQVHGDGPIDLIVVSTFISHVEHVWEDPGFTRFLTRLTGFARLIIWDRRGSGLSDDAALGIEHEVHDINAVLDAAGSERPAVLAYNAGGPLAALHAARFPERVRSLVLYGCLLRAVPRRGPAVGRERAAARCAPARDHRALGPGHERRAAGADVGRRPAAARVAGAPRAARREPRPGAPARRGRRADRRAPGAVVDPRAGARPASSRRRLDRRAPRARVLRGGSRARAWSRSPGVDSLPSAGDMDALLGEIEEFLTGTRRGGEQRAHAADDRLQRHRRQHGPRRAARRQALARPAGGPRPRACGARSSVSRAASSSASETATCRSSQAPRAARCAAPARCTRPLPRTASRCASACTRASAS